MGAQSLTVILARCHAEEQTRACLDHLFRYTDVPFRLVIGAGELTGDLKAPEGVEVVRLAETEGPRCTRVYNQGYSWVSPGSQVVLMDTGVLVPDKWASRILSHFADTGQVGAVGPVGSGMGPWQDFAVWFGEASYDPQAWPLDPRFHYFAEQLYQDQRGWFHTAKILLGSFLVLGPGVMDRVGAFREERPSPWDQTDWCLRARLEGYELVVADDVYVWRGEVGSGVTGVEEDAVGDSGEFERQWNSISGGLSADDLFLNDRETSRPGYTRRQRRATKLDLGAGEFHKPGYIAVDLRPLPHVKVVCDIRCLPYPDESVDAINAGEVLEHFSRAEIEPLLKEWIRVLKPGGEFTVRVPDFGEACRLYAQGQASCGLVNLWIFGAQSHPLDFHKVGFDLVDLTIYLQRAGFIRIERLPEVPGWEYHPRIHLRAYKP